MFRKAAHYLHHKLCSASLLGNTQSFGHCVERQAKGVTIHVRTQALVAYCFIYVSKFQLQVKLSRDREPNNSAADK